MTPIAALIWFIGQAVFTMALLTFGTMAAAGMLTREERAARRIHRSRRRRNAAHDPSGLNQTERLDPTEMKTDNPNEPPRLQAAVLAPDRPRNREVKRDER